ncbi:MAG: TlpA family protein disulfide reductase, partial [Candidatus Marinimicrobia bacterium]|nr:TlpA family protein disulfide reductase [Candidatus Neomarinimicrobiota bacterium]
MKHLTLILTVCSLLFADTLISVGEVAPGFFLRDTQNQNYFLSKHVGKKAKPALKSPQVLSFFASWCIPCRTEIPFLMDMQDEFPDIKFMLINVNEDKKTVAAYIQTMNIRIPVLLDLF